MGPKQRDVGPLGWGRHSPVDEEDRTYCFLCGETLSTYQDIKAECGYFFDEPISLGHPGTPDGAE